VRKREPVQVPSSCVCAPLRSVFCQARKKKNIGWLNSNFRHPFGLGSFYWSCAHVHSIIVLYNLSYSIFVGALLPSHCTRRKKYIFTYSFLGDNGQESVVESEFGRIVGDFVGSWHTLRDCFGFNRVTGLSFDTNNSNSFGNQ
jgi:hypothetical protein